MSFSGSNGNNTGDAFPGFAFFASAAGEELMVADLPDLGLALVAFGAALPSPFAPLPAVGRIDLDSSMASAHLVPAADGGIPTDTPAVPVHIFLRAPPGDRTIFLFVPGTGTILPIDLGSDGSTPAVGAAITELSAAGLSNEYWLGPVITRDRVRVAVRYRQQSDIELWKFSLTGAGKIGSFAAPVASIPTLIHDANDAYLVFSASPSQAQSMISLSAWSRSGIPVSVPFVDGPLATNPGDIPVAAWLFAEGTRVHWLGLSRHLAYDCQ